MVLRENPDADLPGHHPRGARKTEPGTRCVTDVISSLDPADTHHARSNNCQVKSLLLHITNALWISENATQLDAGALSKRISMHTAKAFGRSIPPHWFRDAAATSIAIDNPAHVRDAHLVLGHAGLATTEKHYILAQSLE